MNDDGLANYCEKNQDKILYFYIKINFIEPQDLNLKDETIEVSKGGMGKFIDKLGMRKVQKS